MFPSDQIGLYTDMYELTMAQGYFLSRRKDERAVFDYFFRDTPFAGGYVLFAGLQDLLELFEKLTFSEEDMDYLRSEGFEADFLNYLSTFKFHGTIRSVREGEIVFPYEPILSVEGNIIETQLVETLLLNLLNFESLIATKASRVRAVAGDRMFVDFGLRRAPGYGGIQASRAAAIGGADATSQRFGRKHV